MKNRRGFFVFGTAFLTIAVLAALAVGIWATRLNNAIRERLAGKRWAAPTEYYSAPARLMLGQRQASSLIDEILTSLDYRPIILDRELQEGEFRKLNAEVCAQKMPQTDTSVTNCWVIQRKPLSGTPEKRPLALIAVDGADTVKFIFQDEPLTPVDFLEFEPAMFAQFYGGQPVLRTVIALGDAPPHLLNAIMAIEDSSFLTHKGVSVTGIMRAAIKNISQMRKAEGGSTITQQLVKNYFLTPERTLKRKVTEILMAVLLESQFTKDEILETYINEIYLGQNAPFELHGFGTAARHYFGKEISDLSLSESAILAGLIRGPNIYNPWTNAQKSLQRRNTVLKRMLDLELIDSTEYQSALAESLPASRPQTVKDQAPFFVDAVKIQLQKLEISSAEGLQVFTTLNPLAQQAATDAVRTGLNQIETGYASFVKMYKQDPKTKLQAVLISANPKNGFVEAVVGGRSYSETQLNRAIQSQRQVGSIFKPFVYLAAFTQNDPAGNPYTPLTQVQDEPFTLNYDKQTWSPENYENEYFGQVPIFVAIEKSLNAATAHVAQQIGIDKVIDGARKAGIDSPMMAVPSVALGAATLTPFEVLQAYSTLSRMGSYLPLTFILEVKNATGETLYKYEPTATEALDAIATRQTVSLMEGVMDRGTGRAIRANGFSIPAAGKTGTTNDTKDAWFGGFTPEHAAVVWVGFDQPKSTGLTGASGAVPIWSLYIKKFGAHLPETDFPVPEGAIALTIDPESSMLARPNCSRKARLVFKDGTQPRTECWMHQ
ncbi:MAG: PBP1A family penicillin-binding protein [Oligoflexia bacterium]|nr:PBP1A family penicillin-binding protein [Oligoflexia bacterium]